MRKSAQKGRRTIGERFWRKQGRQGEKLAAGGGCGRFHAMRLDPVVRRSVACGVLVLVACGPVVRPEAPGEEPTPPRVIKRSAPPAGRSALIGEMCPQAAGGRPGLAPLALRDISWSSDRAELVNALARGNAAQFAVLAVDGRKAGTFSAIGTADVGGVEAGIGSFAGSPPCSRPAGGVEVTGDAKCLEAQRGCGLSVATLGAAGGQFSDVETPEIAIGGACKTGDVLAIDIDADGAPEMFPIAAFVDPARAPAEEVSAAAVVVPACTPVFALHGLVPTPAQGVVMDGKHKVELDILGVLDVDSDGRREVVVAFRYFESRTVAVYSAMSSSARLELVGESAPWSP
jgi:hypothetical protein